MTDVAERRALTDEEAQAALIAIERERAGELPERVDSTTLQAPEGFVKLYHPKYPKLNFGPGSMTDGSPMIRFGEAEDHVAIVPADHPLLADLLKRHPRVLMLKPGQSLGIKTKAYLCPDCDKEFLDRAQVKAHMAKAHKDEPAKAKPAPKGKGKAEPPPSDDDED